MERQDPIAIVGTGGIFPASSSVDELWVHILGARDTAREVPSGRWLRPVDEVFAPQPLPDKVYSTRGSFVEDFTLDPAGLDVDADLLGRLDPMFHLLLHAGHQAWQDAVTDDIDRSRVGVVIGNIVLPTDAASALGEEILGPAFESEVFGRKSEFAATKTERLNRYVAGLPAGVLARALRLGGGSYTLDAACASSLYALKLACDELQSGRADLMLTGGLSRPDCLYTQTGFSQLRALSAMGRCSPFDAGADGLVVGEGCGIFALKRLSEAIDAGDHVYAVIAGIGLSNDIGGNLMSPDSEGQLRAMRAAYRQAGWEPHDVDLIECHGTGTPVGDAVEFASMRQLWATADRGPSPCVIGSAKSNIGHLLTAAGSAGLVKVLWALREKTLPPTANFTQAADGIDLAASPFEVLRQPREWLRRNEGTPRRAAISAFGFGGINAHVLLEEWLPENVARHRNRTSVAGVERSEPPDNEAAGELRPTARHTPTAELNGEAAEPAIAIVGIGAHFGPWDSLDLLRGRFLGSQDDRDPSAPDNWWDVAECGRFRGHLIDEFEMPLERFRIPPTELKDMLPQQLLMLKVAASAMDDAGIGRADDPRPNTGAFIGIGLDLNATNFHFRWSIAKKSPDWARELKLDLTPEELAEWTGRLCDAAGPPLTANRTMGALGGIVASRVARAFRIGGPSFTISNEEGSGLRALEVAVRALRRRELDVAVVGAVDFAGDVRVVYGQDDRRDYSATGAARPFDRDADGAIIGEGAAALVLKRHEDAVRDGDTVYALVRGFGAATGGGIDAAVPLPHTYRTALERAYADAGVDPASVGYLETHGSGCQEEDDVEAVALTEFFARGRRETACYIGSAKADVGHAGAAAGLGSIVKATLCLYHHVLPPLRRVENPHPLIAGAANTIFAPAEPQYWLRNRADGPRRAGVSSMSVDGNCLHAVLEEAPRSVASALPHRPLGEPGEAIFVVRANDPGGLIDGLDRLSAFAKEHTATSIESLARRWHRESRGSNERDHTVAFVAQEADRLRVSLANARQCIEEGRAIANGRAFYSPRPLGGEGRLAFVFPGAGNQFAGMGRDLAAHWPEIADRLDDENERLSGQFADGRFWRHRALDGTTCQDVIFAHVWCGTFASDLLQSFQVEPAAVIGYSLGETTGLFATRTWTNRDEMLRRMRASTLFRDELAGRCDAARRTWKLLDIEPVDWLVGVVNRSADDVRQAIDGRERVYLLIVNTPEECVIGGDRQAVMRLVADLNCGFHVVPGVTTVHCEVAATVEKAYRELHLFPTTPPPDVRFYSAAWSKSYEVTRESAADAILALSLRPFDFDRVVRAAYEDGVRIFLELGPGASCTRMIGSILDDQPHVARSVCVAGQNGVTTLLGSLAQLIAEGVTVDLDLLYGGDAGGEIPQSSEPTLTIPVRRRTFEIPQPVARMTHTVDEEYSGNGEPSPIAPSSSFTDASTARPISPDVNVEPLIEQMTATQTARARAQDNYLQFSHGITQTLAGAISFQASLLELASGESLLASETPRQTAPLVESTATAVEAAPALDREQCLEFAIGQIGDVLGRRFAEIDDHPTRVRLPDEPLMLVDRILAIEGKPASMTFGRVVTEHDVKADAWYLDAGRIPTCIAVEAGQADLFLSGYLGIDFETRGMAVYRLLDAVVTFHGPLPGPGATIRYDIHIDRFFRQGETYLFRFRFDATVDSQPLLAMTNGCAGFFTAEELEAGQGVVQTALDKQPMRGKRPDDWVGLAPMAVESYDEEQIEALRAGDLAGCFGESFANLPLTRPAGLPTGRMKLVHHVTALDPAGGRFGLGQITGEADIHADDWFLTCHFVDDRVMPGTLMYECCLHSLRVFLSRMGWIGEADQIAYEPLPGIGSQLKCRGQVTEETQSVQYEVALKELGYTGADGTPYALADALIYADGKPIVESKDMSLRLSGLKRDELEDMWRQVGQASCPSTGVGIESVTLNVTRKDRRACALPLHRVGDDAETSNAKRPPIFDYDRILAFAVGKPSEAFGDRYCVFDEERVIARLPGPPYQFLDRITSIENCQQWQLEPGGVIEAQYDVPPDAWYFASYDQPEMPFAVLAEIALQPCGWLAAYLGSALTSEEDLSFRNLGATAVQHQRVTPATGTLTTTVRLTNVSSSGGMIIQNFDFAVRSASGDVYTGKTNFGYFSKQALVQQVGIRDADVYEPADAEVTRAGEFPYPDGAPYPDAMMRMIDSVELFDPAGGPLGLGFIRATAAVDPDAWFFKAHFYQDPVWPGSLGLESLLQMLRVVAMNRWPEQSESVRRVFSTATGIEHRWIYRGQIIPANRRVTVQAVVTAIDDARRLIRADGHLIVDGRTIYSMNDFTLGTQTD